MNNISKLLKLLIMFLFMFNQLIWAEQTKTEEAKPDNNWYLALLNHVYYNFSPDIPVTDTLKAMVTYIPGNDYYLTIVPSVSWKWTNRTASDLVSLNDVVITLSHGSFAGASPASSLIGDSRWSWALTATLPLSSYSRNSSLITSVSYSLTYTEIFNKEKTSIGVGPYLSYSFRRYKTSQPSTQELNTTDSSKVFNYNGTYFEKLNPYVQLGTGGSITLVHRFNEMTYFIAWLSLDSLRFYDDTVLYNSSTIEIASSYWRTSFSFGQKLFFPITDLLWGDFSLNSMGSVSGFVPFSTTNGNSVMLSAGLSYFF